MPPSSRPREVIERLLAGISASAWTALDELYAEDAVVDYPFAHPAPRRLEGRDAIRRYFEGVATLPLELHARDVRIHETTDPEVVIVEYDYDGRATELDRSFHVSNIQVTRVRDGLIVSSRDYHNHAAMADATRRPQAD